MNMSGNTVLITGGASGIGFALAEAFLATGNEVLICDVREDKLKEAAQKHPELNHMTCDVSEQADREALLQWATSKFDVNVLVNNAGIQRDIDFTKGMENLRGPSEIRVNLESAVYLSALFVPHLLGKKEAAILNFVSGMGFMLSPRPTVPLYTVSKAAIHVFTYFLRMQLANTAVKVFEIIPGVVDTGINPEGRIKRTAPPRGSIQPAEAAAIIMKGLAADQLVIPSAREHYPQPLTVLNEDPSKLWRG